MEVAGVDEIVPGEPVPGPGGHHLLMMLFFKREQRFEKGLILARVSVYWVR